MLIRRSTVHECDRRQTHRQTTQRYGEMCSYRRNHLRCKTRFRLTV